MKKLTAAEATATAAAAALTLAALPMPAAHAQNGLTELSSQSSRSVGSSKLQYEQNPDDPNIQTPKKKPLEGGYTGIAAVSVPLGVLVTAVVIQLIVDNVPPVRQAVDGFAKGAGLEGLPGSSESNRLLNLQPFLAAVLP